MKSIKSKEVKKYLDMPYSYLITQINDESGKYFVARVLELDGLIGTGNTYNEAYEDIKLAMESYIETKLANNVKIPMPIDSSEYSNAISHSPSCPATSFANWWEGTLSRYKTAKKEPHSSFLYVI